MRKKGWEEPSTGPDWMDVIGAMNALSALHSGRVEVNVRLAGVGLATSVEVQAIMQFEALPNSELPKQVEITKEYPDRESRTYAGFVFKLLYELDHKIGEAYRCAPLFG